MTLTTNEERQAERTLLAQTLDLSPEDLESFLQRFGIPKSEYDSLLIKYKQLIEGYRKLQQSENTNGTTEKLQ